MSHAALLFQDLPASIYYLLSFFQRHERDICSSVSFPLSCADKHISLIATEIASLFQKSLEFLPGSLKILYVEDRRKNQCDLTNDTGTNRIKFLLEKGEMT